MTIFKSEEQIEASSNLPPPKNTRGRNKSTIRMIEAMVKIVDEMHPITGRGVGYKLFAKGIIDSMSKKNMSTVYRNLKIAREEKKIRWDWIVDETRALEKIEAWEDGLEVADSFYYRRDLWQSQDVNVEVWSEKGTVRGLLWPVLAELGVGFRVMHGFTSATCVYNVSNNGNDNRPLIALYVGDRDPSGLCMTETDLPQRIAEYGGDHIDLRRIALTPEQVSTLPSFSVETKKKDPRYKWYKRTHGNECWELDAMDPNVLRDLVRTKIESLIDRDLWKKEEERQNRERNSIELALSIGGDPDSPKAIKMVHDREMQRICDMYTWQNDNADDAIAA